MWRHAGLMGLLAIYYQLGLAGYKSIVGASVAELGAVRRLFAAAVCISLGVLQLVMFELLDLLDERTQEIYWRVECTGLLLLIYVVIPLWISDAVWRHWRDMNRSFKCGWRIKKITSRWEFLGRVILWITGPLSVWIIYIGSGKLLKMEFMTVADWRTGWSDYLLAHVGLGGVTLVGALGGYAAVNTPMQLFQRGAWIEYRAIEALGAQVETIFQSLAEKRVDLIARQNNDSLSWWAEDDLEAEICGLECLLDDVYYEYCELVGNQCRNLFHQTMAGRLGRYMGILLSIVGLYRVILCGFGVISPQDTNNSIDWGTAFLLFVLRGLGVELDLEFWVPYWSTIVLGLLISVNMKSFTSRFRSFSQRHIRFFDGGIFLLMICQGLCHYFCGFLLLLRTYIPLSKRHRISHLLGKTLNFSFFHLQFNVIFCISSAITAGAAWWAYRREQRKFKVP